MPTIQGHFVWYDVMTTDLPAAEAFYTRVIGWTAQGMGSPDRPYTVFSVGKVGVGGLMPIPADALAAGMPPCWTGYISVDDVDGFARRVREKGGMVRRGPEDIPGVGRFAVVGDPQGAGFILFRANGTPPDAPLPPDAPGKVGWHELLTDDREAGFAFYADLFGWTKAEAVDLGPMGVYQTFATGGPAVGGMFQRGPGMPGPAWRYYFNVAGIDAAIARVTAGGGSVAQGPMQVPGGSWIANCLDPQGAAFAMVAPVR